MSGGRSQRSQTHAVVSCVALVLTAACGIPEETHNAVVKDLEKCKSELSGTKNSLQTTESERNKLKDQLDSIGADRDALARKLGRSRRNRPRSHQGRHRSIRPAL